MPALPSKRPRRYELPGAQVDAGFDDLSRRAFQAAAGLDGKIRRISAQFTGLSANQPKPAAASSVKHSARRKMRLIHDHIRLRAYPYRAAKIQDAIIPADALIMISKQSMAHGLENLQGAVRNIRSPPLLGATLHRPA